MVQSKVPSPKRRKVGIEILMPEPKGEGGRRIISTPLLQVTEVGALYHDPDAVASQLVKLF